MTRKIAILQSNYIPWKGYFDIIASVDEFILYDDMQYTRRDWRNRNQIKTQKGLQWLTIPVQIKGKYFQTIRETVISDPSWTNSHWRTLQQHYRKAPYFRMFHDVLEELYCGCRETCLSFINYRFIKSLCELLHIPTKLTWSWDYGITPGKTERLVDLCRKAKATEYLSGPGAKGYIQPELFAQAGIKLTFMDYSEYPEYPQLYPPFEHAVSILDLLFNTGLEARKYMKSV
jgi:hypothetical protein